MAHRAGSQGRRYPLNTVAEDADLTMSLLEQGLKVVYEDRSLAFTRRRSMPRADAAAFPLVVWHAAGGVETPRALRATSHGLFALPISLCFRCCCRWCRPLST